MNISCEIALEWAPQDLTYDQSKLVLDQVMVWCCQATSLYLTQCWLLTKFYRPQWVNSVGGWNDMGFSWDTECRCDQQSSEVVIENVTMVAITGTSLLVPYLEVKLPQFIWWMDTRRPNLQMSCRKLTISQPCLSYWLINRVCSRYMMSLFATSFTIFSGGYWVNWFKHVCYE